MPTYAASIELSQTRTTTRFSQLVGFLPRPFRDDDGAKTLFTTILVKARTGAPATLPARLFSNDAAIDGHISWATNTTMPRQQHAATIYLPPRGHFIRARPEPLLDAY